MPVTINPKDLQAITRKLDRLDDARVIRKPLTAATDHIWGKLKREPSKASGTFSAWADRHPAARRAFWAKVGRGEAAVGPGGYIRSGKLYGGWTKEIQQGGRRGVIENEVEGAIYVQGERQTSFHAATRYPKVSTVVEEETDTVVGLFKRAYDAELRK